MKADTIIRRLDKLNLHKNTKSYRLIKRIIAVSTRFLLRSADVYRVYGNWVVVEPVTLIGSGRGTQYSDHTADLLSLLDNINIKYTTKNISKRGGKLGIRIIIKTKITI